VPNRNLALSLLVGAILLAGGCSGDSSSVPCTSAVLIDLDVSSDVEGLELVINEVLWTITGNGMAPMKGAIDTSDPNATPSIEIFGLEPGNYTIDLEATSEDGATTCRGSAMFGVTVGVVTEVAVLLRCSVGQRFGAVRVNGWFNICAELTKAVVAPLQTSIGNAIIVSSQAEDAERDPIEYAWTADNGTFANPSASATFYTCEETGNDQLTISVTDDGFEYCVDNWTVDVRCVDGGGTGGTGGTGATGGVGGTGGTGGTGGSGATGGVGGTGGTGGTGGSGATGGVGGAGGMDGTGGSGATGGAGGGTGGTGGSGATGGTGGTGGGMCEITIELTGS
jgi:hypothetical protein